MQPVISRMATVFTALVLICCAASADGRRIRVALQLPESSHLYESLNFFKQLVESKTDGALEIVIAHSGQLIDEQDAPEAVATGRSEMASVTVNQYAGVIPAADLFVQPFLFTHPSVLAAATEVGSPVRAPIDEAILQLGARVLWWQSNGTTVMVSKGAPLVSPAAIAGQKVRVSTESEGQFVKLCGGVPRIIPAAAQFDAYDKEGLMAGSTTISAVPVRQFWKITDFVTFTRHRTSEFVVIVNERLWQSLSAEHKRVLEGAAQESERRSRERIGAIELEALALAEKHGMRTLELAKHEQDQWKFCASPMIEAYLDRAGELGGRVMSGYRKMLIENVDREHRALAR